MTHLLVTISVNWHAWNNQRRINRSRRRIERYRRHVAMQAALDEARRAAAREES